MLRRVLAAACVAAATLLALQVLRPAPLPDVQVVVAAADVPGGTVLAADDLALQRLPQEARAPGSLTEVSAAVGRRLGSPIAAGEAVTASRIVPRSVTDGLGHGRVALHVLLADPGSADLLVPGDRVAVYPAGGGPELTDDAAVLSVDPPRPVTTLDTGDGVRGTVLDLAAGDARSVLAGHGGSVGAGTVVVALVPTGTAPPAGNSSGGSG